MVLALVRLGSHRRLLGRARADRPAGSSVDPPAAGMAALPWPLSVGLVAATAAVCWYSLGRALSVPIIFADEFIYGNAARGLAEGRVLFGYGYGFVVPAIDATAYLLTKDDVSAYRLIQAINVAVMVSAAFPAYLLARRALSNRSALMVAALTVVVPWMVYSRFVMTEAAFYPIFLGFVLVLVRALERPSLQRQLVLALVLALAFETRTQAVALAGAVVSAVVLYGFARGDLRGNVRLFVPTWALYASIAACAAAVAAAGFWRPLGAYDVLMEEGFHPRGLVLGAAANIVALTLGLGVLAPVAAPLGAGTLLGSSAKSREHALAAAAVSSVIWLVITVSVVSVSPHGLGLMHERGLFFVGPLLLILAFAWAARGFPRPPLLTTVTTAGMVIIAILMPIGVVTTNSLDALSFKLWARIPRDGMSAATLIVLAIAVGALIVVRLRSTWPLAASVLLAAVGVAAASDYRFEHPRSLTEGYGWVDRVVPAGASATILFIGADESRCATGTVGSRLEQLTLYTEYFNSRIGPVGYLITDNAARHLSTDAFAVRRDGVVTRAGTPIRSGYVVTDARVGIVGSRVALLRARDVGLADAREGSALALWRAASPLRLARPSQALSPSAACAPFPTTVGDSRRTRPGSS